jgi:hypothetical protein
MQNEDRAQFEVESMKYIRLSIGLSVAAAGFLAFYTGMGLGLLV